MKKIVPFKKEIVFKTNLSEITSISLEHTLHVANGDENLITGEFIVSGDYKIADSSINTESFHFDLPFDINLDEHYLLDHITVDIDDFYYEIINNNVLVVNIEVCIDKLQEKPLLEEVKRVITELPKEEVIEEIKEPAIEKERLEEIREKEDDEMEEVVPIPVETEEEVKAVCNELSETKPEERITTKQIESLFDSLDDSAETYSTYHVYIVRDGDTLEGIIQKYGTSLEELEPYNDLQELKLGDKLIIPAISLAKNS